MLYGIDSIETSKQTVDCSSFSYTFENVLKFSTFSMHLLLHIIMTNATKLIITDIHTIQLISNATTYLSGFEQLQAYIFY